MKWAINCALLASRSANSWGAVDSRGGLLGKAAQHFCQFAIVRLNTDDIALCFFGDAYRFPLLAIHIPAKFQVVRENQDCRA